MGKTERKLNSGFTLAELLVVVAIIAVLVTICIPIFSASVEKSQSAVCSANRRSLVGELSSEYILGNASVNADGTVPISSYQASQYACPKDGELTAVYDAPDGAIYVYCSEHQPYSSLSDVAAQLAALAGLRSNAAIARYYANNGDTLPALSNGYPIWDELIDKWTELYGKTPSFQDSIDTLYWRPSSVSLSNGQVDYIMYASPTAYNASSNHAQWKGYVCFYDGVYYVSNELHSYSGKIESNSVATGTAKFDDGDIPVWLTSNGWVAVS